MNPYFIYDFESQEECDKKNGKRRIFLKTGNLIDCAEFITEPCNDWHCEENQLKWYDHQGIGVTQRDPEHKVKTCVLQCAKTGNKNSLIYFKSDKESTIALQSRQPCPASNKQ